MPLKDPVARAAYQTYMKAYLAKPENQAAHIARVNKNRDTQRTRMYAYVNELKKAPCTDCGLCFPPVCMDFDHISDDKDEAISRMITSGISLDRLKREIAKCELVCSNCHRIRTWHTRRLDVLAEGNTCGESAGSQSGS